MTFVLLLMPQLQTPQGTRKGSKVCDGRNQKRGRSSSGTASFHQSTLN
jgi:hypothetical protein